MDNSKLLFNYFKLIILESFNKICYHEISFSWKDLNPKNHFENKALIPNVTSQPDITDLNNKIKK